LFFKNYFPQAVQEGRVVLFVDDTTTLLIEKNLTSLKGKILKVMKQLQNWFLTNNLVKNMERTKAILYFREEDPD
jgi:hypothetical protein